MRVFDSHIHLFERPYGDMFINSHIKDGQLGEFHLYEQYRRKFGIEGAFVICYQNEQWPDNNGFVLKLAREHQWIYPFGHIQPNPKSMVTMAALLKEMGCFGLSCYFADDDNGEWLRSSGMSQFWSYIEENLIPFSLNLCARQCVPLQDVLTRYPRTRLLISHMARPVFGKNGFNQSDYAPLLALSDWEGVYVKLSGFYAFVDDGWRYPQRALFKVVDMLKDCFGVERLLFGSDFSPVLEYNTYRQTLELLRMEYNGFRQSEIEKVYWGAAASVVEWAGKWR